MDNLRTNSEHCISRNKNKDAPLKECVIPKMWYNKQTFLPRENCKNEKVYIEITEWDRKERFYNDRHSFTNPLLSK